MGGNGHGVSFGGDKNVLELTVAMGAQLCGYTKTYCNCTL